MSELTWGWENIGDTGKNWPHNIDGSYESPAFLENATGSQFEIDMEKSMLASFGIPVIEQYPLDGSFGKIILGMSGTGVDLYVPQSMLEDAKQLINGEFEFSEDESEGKIWDI